MPRALPSSAFPASPTRLATAYPPISSSRAYRVIPVNPFLEEGLGEPVDLVLIFQRSENVPPFVDDAINIGAKAVWMQLGIAHPDAAAQARNAGLDVVQNACMLVEHKRWVNGR